jgi:multidrug efflux pump subunit AcrA (membrane-fusion protein)
VIVEKNFNVGDILDPTQDLFKIADLSRIQVVANAYEEDLPRLRALPPEQRHWRIDITADPNDVPMSGNFDIVGNIIDPTQHSGTVIGWLDNPSGRLSVGAFITAVIPLPPDPSLVVLPTSALIDEGGCAKVFVQVDGQPNEFASRQVVVVTRGRERTYVRAKPRPEQCDGGAEPLSVGERVVKSGTVGLAAQLASLQAKDR